MTPVLVKYDDLEALVKSAFHIKKRGPLTGPLPYPEMVIQKSGSLRSKMQKMTFEEYIERCRASKIWGYTNNGRKIVIRYWISPKAKIEDILEFFAHEIGHHMGKKYANHLKEEEKAREFEVTAVVAYRLAKDILKKKRANK